MSLVDGGDRSSVRHWRRYSVYKDSGVEWLGEIPGHWEVKKVKYLCQVKRGASPRPIDDPIYFDDEGEYSWVRISDVTASNKYLSTTEQKLSPLGRSKSVSLEPGELFLSIAATVGKPIITSIKCCIHDGFVYFLNLKQSRDYLFYTFSGGELYKGLGKTGTQLNLNTYTIGEIKIPVPPLDEQRAIASFLDKETFRIDKLVEKKEKLLELLQEKRTALISHAVTKGLDATVTMKDSGIEWLGEIPRHWEVKRLKWVADVSYGLSLELDRTETEGTSIISLPNVTKEGQLLLEDVPKTILNADQKKELLLKKGDLLFNWRNGSPDHIGKTAYFNADDEYTHVSFLVRLRFNNSRYESRYYQMFLNGLRNTEFFSAAKTRVNRTYNQTELRKLEVAVPPLDEQRAIASYLDKETEKLDNLIAKIRESIETQKEYRTALISAAVTGKIDVSKN